MSSEKCSLFKIWEHGRILPPASESRTFHTNPKRKRGNALTPSLALRVSVNSDRGKVSNAPWHIAWRVSEILWLEFITIERITPASSSGR